MGAHKSDFLHACWETLPPALRLSSIADFTATIAEISHLIQLLPESLELKRLENRCHAITLALPAAITFADLTLIAESVRKARLDLRRLYRRSTTLMATGWQSPPMDSALDPSVSESAREALESGRDYHRAAHLAGSDYERSFRETLFGDHPECRALLTNCGMGAISTALYYLANRIAEMPGPVVVDEGCYHETRFLVETLFRSRLRYSDLSSPNAVASLGEMMPALVIFDSTRNSRKISALPVGDILAGAQKMGSYVLIDTTSLVSAAAVVAEAKDRRVFKRIFIATSLAKMHQYGMDLVTAGALVYDAQLDATFPSPTSFRTHLGMNISEDSAATLPRPSLDLLEQRAARMSRNVETLASLLRGAARDLSVETAPCWGDAGRHVPYFNIGVSRGDEVAWYRAFMTRVMEAARRRGVPLIAGTSFGFDITRIYLVESLIPTHRAFIRVSPGMESAYESALVAETLVEAAGGQPI